MKNAKPMPFLLALISIWMAVPSCAGRVPGPVTDFGQCLSDSVAPQVAAILADVAAALESHDYMALLANIGRRAGFSIVDCAVSQLLGRARGRYEATGDARAKDEIARSHTWLTR